MTQEGFLLAGVPIALPSTFSIFLTRVLQKYSRLIESLLVIPSLSMQLRFLVLSISCRPTSTFAHFLRSQPPTVTNALCDISDLFPGSVPTPFVHALYRLVINALARIIRIPSTAFVNATVARGTRFQLSLRAKEGGINLPDPAILAPAAFLGSLADTLPILLLDPILQPFLSDPSSWPTSCSTTLSDAHLYFRFIAPLLTRQSDSPVENSVASLLSDPNGQPSLALLYNVAQKHSQCVFSTAIFGQRLSRAFEPPFFTTEITRARLRHSAVPGAQGLFGLRLLSPEVSLNNQQFQYLVCMRLGLPLPFLTTPPPNHCHPRCHFYPPSRPFPPALSEISALSLHFAACGVLQMRHARHNSIVRLIGEAARHEMSMVPDYSYATSSSTTSNNNIDLVLESFHLQPPSVGIDVTVSHPLLPTYSGAAALDSLTMFLHRERTKDLHHRAGCINQGKSFLPVVFSTLSGVSPRAREFLDYLFRCAHTTEIESGGTGQHTIARRQLFYDEIAAVIARSGTAMSLRLGSPPHPSDFD